MKSARLLQLIALLFIFKANIGAQENCLSFAADSEPYDYVDIGTISNLADFTIETWLYINSFSSYGPQIGSDEKTDGCRIKFSAADIKVWTTSTDSWSAAFDVAAAFQNKWSHFALTFSNGTASIYINGQAAGSTDILPSPSSFVNFCLGTAHTNRYMDGKIEEFRLWSKALTEAEINQFKKRTLFSQSESTHLTIHYDFDRATTNQIKNIANPGTYDGTAVFKSLDEAFIPSDAFIPSTPIAAHFSPSSNACQTGSSVTFINQSTGEDLSYSWTLPGGHPASSTNASPSVQYNIPGSYDVSLEVRNSTFTHTLTQQGIIWVGQHVTSSGTSVLFDGIDDYVFLPGPITNRTSNYTIEFWLYLKSSGKSRSYITIKPAPFYFGTDSDLRIKAGFDEEFELEDTDASNDSCCVIETDPGILDLYTWQHYAFVFNQGLGILYKNGQEIGRDETITPDAPGWDGTNFSDFMTLGSSVAQRTLNGQLDEVRIWDSSRPVDSIKKYMTKPLPTIPENLLLYYQFNNTDILSDTILANKASTQFYGKLRLFNTNDALQSSGAFTIEEAQVTSTNTLTLSNEEIPFRIFSRNGELTIQPKQNSTYSITIYDLTGRSIYKQNTQQKTMQIALPKNTYILELSANNQSYRIKYMHL
jgi:PKD repeat protein